MTKRRLLRWALLLVTLAAFAVWLEPTRVVWGWLRGEAFYQGRPTSWWRQELSNWQIVRQTMTKLADGRIRANIGGVIVDLPANVNPANGDRIQEGVQFSLVHAPREGMLDWFAAKVLGRKRQGSFKSSTLFLEADFEQVLGELQIDPDGQIRAKTDVIASHLRKSKAELDRQ